jgi:hypothetical protein
MELLKNRKLLTRNIVSHLSYEYLNFKDYSGMKFLSPMHIGNRYLVEDLKYYQTYVIENIFNRKLKIRFNINDKNRKTPLDEFIAWNSNIFTKFLKSNELEETADKFLQENYPMFFNELKRYLAIEYVNHELATFSFDDLYQKRGLNSFETILNVEIWHQRFIHVENKIINFDATTFPTQKFVAGNWQFGTGDKKNLGVQVVLRPSKISVNLSEAIYLMGRCDENWYHFLLDTAPRLLFFENVPAHVPILVRSDLPLTTKEFLKKLTPRNVIEVEPDKTAIVSRLYVCPGRSTVFDSTPPKGLNQVEFSPLVLKLFRDRVFSSLGINSSSYPDNRISFERNSAARNVINWADLRKVLIDFSFQVLPLDINFFRIQAKVFHDAKFVVAPGGAVMANIIFMKPGTKVLVMRSWRGRNLKLWEALSQSVNLKYVEITGFPTYWGFNFLRKIHSDYYISFRKLRRILSKEILSRT